MTTKLGSPDPTTTSETEASSLSGVGSVAKRKTATYRNPWYSPNRGGDPEFYTTDARPMEYRGVLVYQRIKGRCWDYVKDGVCLTQRAGASRYREVIDELLAQERGGNTTGFAHFNAY